MGVPFKKGFLICVKLIVEWNSRNFKEKSCIIKWD